MVAWTAGPEWSGSVRGPDFFGPVRGPDISVRIFLVRCVVRIFWKKLGLDQFRLRNFGPVRILVLIFENEIIRIGPNLVRNASVRSGFSQQSGFLQDKNYFRNKVNKTYKSLNIFNIICSKIIILKIIILDSIFMYGSCRMGQTMAYTMYSIHWKFSYDTLQLEHFAVFSSRRCQMAGIARTVLILARTDLNSDKNNLA